MQELVEAKFSIGNIVKHKFLDFRGVIFDLDPKFNGTEEWYNAIPKNIRPKKINPTITFLLKMKRFFILHMCLNKIWSMINLYYLRIIQI